LPEAEDVRRTVGALGVLLVVVKGATLVVLPVLGEDLLWGPIELACFVLGIASILTTWYLRDPSPRKENG
jgi:hypothetical protein